METLSFFHFMETRYLLSSTVYCLRVNTRAFPRGLTDEDRIALRIEALENK